MKVKECMCDDVCCVTSDTKIKDVAKLMAKQHIGSVPITDENSCLCGIVTDRDIILRTVACDKSIADTAVSEIMTTNVCSCTEEEEISEAECKMSKNQIRRLPVCDANNKVIGILTLGNLAQNTSGIGEEEVCKTVEKICNCTKDQNAE